jgi:hypothetical protein
MAEQLGVTAIDSLALVLGRTEKPFSDVSADVKEQMASGALVTSTVDDAVYAKGSNGNFFEIGSNRVPKQKSVDNAIIARPDKIEVIGAGNATVTGAIKIKIPVNQPLMGKMRIELLCNNLNNAKTESMSITISGHHDSTAWTVDKCSVQVADSNGEVVKVRFCTDSEGAYVLIGENDSEWYYTRVCITEVITNNIPGGNFSDESNWDISVVADAIGTEVEALVYGNAPKYRVFTDINSGIRYKEYYEDGTKKIEEL